MTISIALYRLWREAADAGLRITPAHYRDPETGALLDHAYRLSGPRPQDTKQMIIADLGSFLEEWLAGFYADPAARTRAAAQALGDLCTEPVVPFNELAARMWENPPGD